MITIRNATINDAEVLALLGRTTYVESHGQYIANKTDLFNYNNSFFSVEKLKEDLKDKNNLFSLIYYNMLPVGYIKLVKNSSNKNIKSTNVCKLERLYILNDFVGKKIGSKAMEHIIEKITELKFEELWLAVYYKNNKAINFYKKYGFVNVGNIIFKVENSDFDNYVLSKKL